MGGPQGPPFFLPFGFSLDEVSLPRIGAGASECAAGFSAAGSYLAAVGSRNPHHTNSPIVDAGARNNPAAVLNVKKTGALGALFGGSRSSLELSGKHNFYSLHGKAGELPRSARCWSKDTSSLPVDPSTADYRFWCCYFSTSTTGTVRA